MRRNEAGLFEMYDVMKTIVASHPIQSDFIASFSGGQVGDLPYWASCVHHLGRRGFGDGQGVGADFFPFLKDEALRFEEGADF